MHNIILYSIHLYLRLEAISESFRPNHEWYLANKLGGVEIKYLEKKYLMRIKKKTLIDKTELHWNMTWIHYHGHELLIFFLPSQNIKKIFEGGLSKYLIANRSMENCPYISICLNAIIFYLIKLNVP